MIWALHGALGSPADWSHLELENAMPVDVYADVRPFSDWARGFCERVRACDGEPVLVGYSMGGRLALHALLEDPGMWRSAIIVSAHTGLPDPGERAARRERDREWQRKVLDTEWGAFMSEWNSQRVFESSPDVGQRVEPAERRRAIAKAFDVWSLGRQEDLLPRMAELVMPVLWVVGERDRKFFEIGRDAAEHLPDGRVCVVPDAGHRVPRENADAFERLVKAEWHRCRRSAD